MTVATSGQPDGAAVRAPQGAAAEALAPARRGTRTKPRALIALVLLGLAVAAAPLAFQMFTRAPKGATMLADFKPFMTTARLNGYQQEIARIDAAVHEVDGPVTKRLGAATVSGSDYAQLQQQWPTIHSDMTDLLDKVQGNLGNYRAVAALPSFRMFPWFFVLPGVVVAAVAAFALVRPGARRPAMVALAVLGVALIAAPAVFQMFTRAPQGGRMMTAFKTIETRQKVTAIQGYFSTMAVGQGAIRLDIEPALQRSGLTAAQVQRAYPAVAALDRDWVHTLNDMTPMIGAMSDNVVNYQAIKALPPFPLFPYFFVIPGVAVVALAIAAGRTRPVDASISRGES
jgi:hypothetical protein